MEKDYRNDAVIVGVADRCPGENELAEVGPDYVQSVYAAGAIPFLLPATTDAEAIAAMLDCVDMLLLPGGGDIEPSRFGEEPHETLPIMAFQFHPERLTDDPHFVDLIREALSQLGK